MGISVLCAPKAEYDYSSMYLMLNCMPMTGVFSYLLKNNDAVIKELFFLFFKMATFSAVRNL